MPLRIPPSDYHSAHKRPLNGLPELDRWDSPDLTAMVHDILSAPLPAEFETCDVLVADLPWQKGFAEFNQRAGVTDGRSYREFMRAVSTIVETATAPVYLITGRHALPTLPTPDALLPMMLNEDTAIAICYRPGDEAAGSYGVAPEFLHALAQRYQRAGDFCCGYGRTGRMFLRSRKQAVLSDFNPHCIGYIAEHASQWESI